MTERDRLLELELALEAQSLADEVLMRGLFAGLRAVFTPIPTSDPVPIKSWDNEEESLTNHKESNNETK